ncbi:site-specific integrase [Pseudomonas sp. 681]|uniref:Site-specific integrase n=1 Tax=Pseudomonas fungipugnans TaxID=3024217 RepID=A0ABT6QXC4_9PSED|nr:site-specific integrase [Pseudomonas sp. 681]MDI2592730.1 site-specific integrase [Pseudomonas sp. 681]MDI2595567.1 site-specific integrase [Pseudomonas sp. 681]
MKLLWPGKQSIPEISEALHRTNNPALADWYGRRTLREIYIIPLVVDGCGNVVREVHEFLYEKAYYSNALKISKTVKTYAECLVDWMVFSCIHELDWKFVSNRNIALYRNHLKEKTFKGRTLSARTINLRLTVVVEFYRHYWSSVLSHENKNQEVIRRKLIQLNARNFKVRISKQRPRALPPETCRLLMQSLNGAQRLIFAWTLTTGMRIGSVLSISLAMFKDLDSLRSDGFVEVTVKGGKLQKVYVPKAVIEETRIYIATTRALSLNRPKFPDVEHSALFINSKGEAVTSGCYYTAYKRACLSLKVTSHPHQARTTFATYVERRLLSASKSLGLDSVKIIQGLLGHASSSTTQDYLESISGNNIDVLELLDKQAAELRGLHE